MQNEKYKIIIPLYYMYSLLNRRQLQNRRGSIGKARATNQMLKIRKEEKITKQVEDKPDSTQVLNLEFTGAAT